MAIVGKADSARSRVPTGAPLVAMDFSETSRFAVHLALRLTDMGTSSIDVVHAHGARDDELPLDFVAGDYEQAARTVRPAEDSGQVPTGETEVSR